jgi:hypothetical protein
MQKIIPIPSGSGEVTIFVRLDQNYSTALALFGKYSWGPPPTGQPEVLENGGRTLVQTTLRSMIIDLCLFGCGLVVNSAPIRQSGLGPPATIAAHMLRNHVSLHSLPIDGRNLTEYE